jgi:hypothetical protein
MVAYMASEQKKGDSYEKAYRIRGRFGGDDVDSGPARSIGYG